MPESARILGQSYGLTAEEMNRVLVKEGILYGEPGNYSPTEKGMPYAIEKAFHRGPGGYSCYNRDWTTISYDESIKEVLEVSPDVIREVRAELTAERAARSAAQASARAKANADFLAKQESEKAAKEAAERAALEAEELIAKWKKAGKIGAVIGSVLVLGYVVYKVTPKVKAWWNERKQLREIETCEAEDNNEDASS